MADTMNPTLPCMMSTADLRSRTWRERKRGAPTSRAPCNDASSLHVLHHRLGLAIVDDVGNRQHHGGVAGVLPPVLRAEELARDVAGLVQDRDEALAAVLVDLAGVHHDERGPIGVRMERHDAAGLDLHVAKAKASLVEL